MPLPDRLLTRRTMLLLLLTAVFSGCTGSDRPASRPDSAPVPDSPPRPADSLALRTAGGIEVWFTDARTATGESGETCLERALEVRQDTLRRGVPLLYTREAPTPLGRDAMRAVLYNRCVPVAAYRVDFATISPKRLAR